MKKWSFLVAALLLSATATTFTSCVDTDEPEGILEMRKAKAEYIRALAAVENAKIAYQQAAAQTESANAELFKAQAEAAKAQAEIAKAQAQSAIIQAEAAAKAAEIVAEGQKTLDEAKAEIAKAEAAKILAEAADEEARTQQLIAENQIKLKEYEAKLQVVLQNEETNLVKAKAQYEAALKDIAAMELVLSPKESAVLAAAKLAYTTAEGQLATAYGKVIKAQKALLKAVYGDEDDYETLQKNLADAQAELAAMNQVVADLETLSNSMTITDFEKQRDALKQKYGYNTDAPVIAVGGSYQVAIDSLNVLIAQAKADNKDLEKAYDDAKQATIDATAEITKATNKKYNVDAVEVTITDGTVAKALASQTGYEAKQNADGSYTYKLKVAKQENKTLADMKADAFAPTSAIKNWLKALGASQNVEDLGANDIKLKAAKTALENAQKEYAKKVEAFDNMLKQHLEKKAIVTVPTTTIDNAVAAYKTALTTLENAVKNYNDAYDKKDEAYKTAYKTAYGHKYDELLNADKFGEAKTKIAAILTTAGIPFDLAKQNTVEKVKAAAATVLSGDDLKSVNKKIDDAVVEAWKALSLTKIEGYETVADSGAKTYAELEAVKDQKYKDACTKFDEAKTALSEAEYKKEGDKETGVKAAYAALSAAYTKYADEAKEKAQIMVDKDGKEVADAKTASENIAKTATGVKKEAYPTGAEADLKAKLQGEITVDTWYVAEYVPNTEKNKYEATNHYKVVRQAIDEATVKQLTAVNLKEKYAEDAWKNASNDAFGVLRYVAVSEAKTSTDKVKDEVTNDFQPVGGALLDLLKAQEALASCEMSAGTNEAANDAIKAINEAKAKVDAVITAAQKAVDDAKKAETDAKEAEKTAKNKWEATFNGFEKEQEALAKTETYESKVLTALNNAIAAYYQNTYVEYEDETGNIVRKQVNDVEDLKSWAKAQAKNYTKKAGKIEKQQEKIADYEKVVKRLEENGYSHTDKDGVLHDYIVADKQYAVEIAQAEYDYIKAEFDNAAANLAKVIEALGNGIDGVPGISESTTTSGAQGGSSSYNANTASNTATNITL